MSEEYNLWRGNYIVAKINHTCKRCGDCCRIHWGSFGATYDDIFRWRNEGRTDILKHLGTNIDDSNGEHPFISNSCPFLRKNEEQNVYYCAINDTKPFHCRNYPDDGVCEYMADLSEESD